MQAILLFFLTALFSLHGPRTIYDKPSSIVSSSLGETIMANPVADTTYRFAAYVETHPVTGCEYDSTADLVLEWTRITAGVKTPHGLPGWHRYRVTIRKDGLAEGELILFSVFRARAGTRVSYRVDYSAGKGCAPRPSYQVFPVLEKLGTKGGQ